MSWLRNRELRRQAVADQVTAALRGEIQPGEAMAAKSTWSDRLVAWLFPRPTLPEMEDTPDFVPGFLETHVITQFGMKDRLRILLTGRVHVCLRTKTDEAINRSYSNAVTWAEPARPL